MLKVPFIMIGGGMGAALRHGLFVLVQGMTAGEFPAGTMVVNLSGSFFNRSAMGVTARCPSSPETRLFIFTRETAQLIKVGQIKEAILYLGGSNILDILLVFVGFFSAQHLILAFSK